MFGVEQRSCSFKTHSTITYIHMMMLADEFCGIQMYLVLFTYTMGGISTVLSTTLVSNFLAFIPSYYKRFSTGNGEILPCVGSDQLPFRVKLLVVTRENCCQLISTRVMLNPVVVGVVVVI